MIRPSLIYYLFAKSKNTGIIRTNVSKKTYALIVTTAMLKMKYSNLK